MKVEHKGYSIEGDGSFGMKVIRTTGAGGRLPASLSGSFTNFEQAMKQIDAYLIVKENTNAKKSSAVRN